MSIELLKIGIKNASDKSNSKKENLVLLRHQALWKFPFQQDQGCNEKKKVRKKNKGSRNQERTDAQSNSPFRLVHSFAHIRKT